MDENQKFIDAEYCIDQYFEQHIASRLDLYAKARLDAVVGGKSTGFGIRNTFAPSQEYANNVTLNFPANDIEKVFSNMRSDKALSNDLLALEAAWGNAVIEKIGEDKYNQLCSQLGCDLAEAYINHRLAMRMVDYEVDHHSYSGSLDYIFDESRRSSMMSHCPRPELQQYIDRKVIERYNPSLLEKGTGKVLGALSDTLITSPALGVGSWNSFAANLGLNLAIDVNLEAMDNEAFRQFEHDNDVSRIMSKAIFGRDDDVFTGFRQSSSSINPYSSEIVQKTNQLLSSKIIRSSSSGILDNSGLFSGFGMQAPTLGNEIVQQTDMQIAHMQQQTELHFAMREKFGDNNHDSSSVQDVSEQQPLSQSENGSTKSVGGWGGMLDQLGLSGFGAVGKNLGYVLAMLPDMLIGMFTGKSRNLKFGDNLLPIGAIVAGMFVKNPLLKMLFIGLGGANLLNKAGHEALEHGEDKRQPVKQYRIYQDEPLDLRLNHPALKGNTLVVNIDNIPMVITINNEAVDAYEKGVLPINTLANAVLRKYDEQQKVVAENYEQVVSQENTVERSRGLKQV